MDSENAGKFIDSGLRIPINVECRDVLKKLSLNTGIKLQWLAAIAIESFVEKYSDPTELFVFLSTRKTTDTMEETHEK